MRRPARRTQAGQFSVPAPVKGIVENDPTSVKGPMSAEWIENFLPTVRGLKVRGGTAVHATVAGACKSLFVYSSGASQQIFAATDAAFYEVTSSASEEDEVVSGISDGVWSVQQMGVSGGDYLIAVNGTDFAQIFDGADWAPLIGVSVNKLTYDALTADFEIGETVTGGTSGASATIVGMVRTTGTTGTLYTSAITSGPFQDNESITSASGAADADGVNSVASSLALTGVNTDSLSHVWLHQNRLFFVEKDSLRAWYLPAGSIAGAASDINLAGVFQRGGTLMFGATWSLDSGDGLDDKCVFVTTEGEVAIYSGTDPSDASTWSLEGRYDIGRPLSARGVTRIGGDLLIATDDGIVPLSAALTKDPAELSLAAVSRPIRTTWAVEVGRGASDMQLFKWTNGEVMLSLFSEASRALSANLQTRAWAIQTGWHGLCGAELVGNAYIGQSDGVIKQINTTGADMDAPFVAKVCCAFTHVGDPLSYKMPSMARGAYFADKAFNARYGMAVDYNVTFQASPLVAAIDSDAMIWGADNWGDATWGAEVENPTTGVTDYWASVTGAGWALAPTVQITSGGTDKLPVELLRIDVIAEGGGRAA